MDLILVSVSSDKPVIVSDMLLAKWIKGEEKRRVPRGVLRRFYDP